MVAIGGSPNRSEKQGSRQKRSILAQKGDACQESQRVSLEESLFFVYAQNHRWLDAGDTVTDFEENVCRSAAGRGSIGNIVLVRV